MSESFQAILALDGVRDHLRLVDNPSLRLSSYTVEVWLRLRDPPDRDWTGVLGKPGRAFCVWVRRPGLIHHRFHTTKNRNAGAPNTADGSFTWGRWHHVAITNDGTTARTYIDGALQAEGKVDGTIVVDATTFTLGVTPDTGEGASALEAAELRIFSVARSQAEIEATMHRRLRGDEAALVLCWPLRDGTARDISANGNHGEVVGDPQIVFDTTLPIEDDVLELGRPVLGFAGAGHALAGPLPAFGEAITVEFWALSDLARSARAAVIEGFDPEGKVVLGVHLPWAGEARWYAGAAAPEGLVHPLQANEYRGAWTHWAFVKESAAGRMAIFRNGALWAAAEGKHRGFAGPIAKLVIGAGEAKGALAKPWTGALSELRIWSCARDPEALRAAMHHRLRGDEPGLVACWPLDEGEGETLQDRGPHRIDGRAVGVEWPRSGVPLVDPEREPGASTGLADYAYWWKWKESLVRDESERARPFRRGRIWA